MKYSKLPIRSWFKTSSAFEFWKKKDGKILKHFRKAIKLARLFKSPAVVANFQIFSITISRSSIIHTLYNWSLIVTSLDLLTIRFRSLKLKLWIRLSIHRFFLSSRVNYNIFLFYPNACLFEWFLVRWQKKKSKSCKSITDIRMDSYKRYGDDKLVKIARFSPSGGEEFFQFSVLTSRSKECDSFSILED